MFLFRNYTCNGSLEKRSLTSIGDASTAHRAALVSVIQDFPVHHIAASFDFDILRLRIGN
jgi:hypothetical protein